MALIARVSALTVVVAAVYACSGPTEMTIRVTTRIPCHALKGVAIAVAPTSSDAEHRVETNFYAAETTQCDSDSVVGTLVLTPGSSSFSVIVVAGVDGNVTACAPPLYRGCIVARRRLSFVEHKSFDVPIDLTPDCVDVPCNTDTSCVHGNCKSVETACDAESCTQVGGSADGDGGGADGAAIDGGGAGDGNTADAAASDGAAGDAPIDADDGAATGAAFTKQWYCSSSPDCQGAPAPCSCGGQVMVDAGTGTPMVEMMTLDCKSGAAQCNCLIENAVANTIANNGVCSQAQYGMCCNH